mgnify:CR=1 FL=1
MGDFLMKSREYPERPLIGVGVVVLGAENVLMIQRSKPPRVGGWSLPGGAQKLGEKVYEAAIREVREETNIDVEVMGLIDVVDSIHRDKVGVVQYHYTLVDVLARSLGGELAAGDDAVDAEWVATQDIAGMELWSETKRIIQLAIEMAEIIPDWNVCPE